MYNLHNSQSLLYLFARTNSIKTRTIAMIQRGPRAIINHIPPTIAAIQRNILKSFLNVSPELITGLGELSSFNLPFEIAPQLLQNLSPSLILFPHSVQNIFIIDNQIW